MTEKSELHDDASSEVIDNRLEGRDQGEEETSETDRGYDEGANSGPSRYAVPEGEGGVFGTTGGGTYAGGFQVVERAGINDRSGEPDQSEERNTIQRDEAESRHDRT